MHHCLVTFYDTIKISMGDFRKERKKEKEVETIIWS